VAEDHQTRNALALSEKDAAVMVADNNAIETLIGEALSLIGDEAKRRSLSLNIVKLAERDTDLRIAREVMNLIRE
jgi:UDP-N-acetylglucosamine--N-acetylmuramyl-(pentapeptide) pyrophosphoryl-undecaprenol N-acetylglucosamine transferase